MTINLNKAVKILRKLGLRFLMDGDYKCSVQQHTGLIQGLQYVRTAEHLFHEVGHVLAGHHKNVYCMFTEKRYIQELEAWKVGFKIAKEVFGIVLDKYEAWSSVATYKYNVGQTVQVMRYQKCKGREIMEAVLNEVKIGNKVPHWVEEVNDG